MEKVISVTHLKASLSACLNQVKSGEEILVLERGRAIARIVPFVPVEDSEEELRLQRLIQGGILKPGNGRSLRQVLEGLKPARATASVVQAVLDERESGW